MSESIDRTHSRPEGASDALVAAAGRYSEGLEHIERARGALYEFHQLMGHADLLLDDAVEGLRAEGHAALADRIETELQGSNVLAGRWTFQIVEEFDDGYYTAWKQLGDAVLDETMDGRRHVFEAEMKQRRRTHRRDGHQATPADV